LKHDYHTFHIPVMGTGHSIDTPIRLAHFGISSVISIIDDILIDKVREHYNTKHGIPHERITRFSHDARARRITAYLETVQTIVNRKMDEIRALPFFSSNEKATYFELLPQESPLKQEYRRLLDMPPGNERTALEQSLTERMRPGSIEVNIMTKLDRLPKDKHGKPLSEEFSDAKAALRGFMNSSLQSAVEFSAGLNQGLFNYMTRFKDFYRTESGSLKKKIVLKVSDFRSAMIQGKLLAKKGLEVHEFRIESGLNCGGHAFGSNGMLLPDILREFREKRDELKAEFLPLILKFYETMGWKYPDHAMSERPLVTAQGGIGTSGEDKRLRETFDLDSTGWATPFLLVPEATCLDDATRELLVRSTGADTYLSDVSPLGVAFNNLKGTGSELWTKKHSESARPGSPCPKGYLVSNTEFTVEPICTASTQYQSAKRDQIAGSGLNEEDKAVALASVYSKTCLCEHLGNPALIALGIAPATKAPQAICPGPNIAWFNRLYSLREMVDHIYGRIASLVPEHRPHMFAREIELSVDEFQRMVTRSGYSGREIAAARGFRENLERGMEFCLSLNQEKSCGEENLSSIERVVAKERARLESIWLWFETQASMVAA
jgi:hypothetical protein